MSHEFIIFVILLAVLIFVFMLVNVDMFMTDPGFDNLSGDEEEGDGEG